MRPRIVLVEDNETLRELLRDRLSAHGFEVCETASANEAMERVACYAVDLVLTDQELPGLSGVDLCRKLRRMGAATGQAIPVVLMTGKHDPNFESEALAAGVSRILLKPFPIDQLCSDMRAQFSEGPSRIPTPPPGHSPASRKHSAR